ncbi:MAG: hypothetical protein AAF907_14005, partial [Planctomycetota bacterium]
LAATVACNVGEDLCKRLPPALLDFECRSLVKLNALYALALANLGRFYEAHRRLNDAHATLSAAPNVSPADHAAVRLRRAECLLTECVWLELVLDRVIKKQADRPEEDQSKKPKTERSYIVREDIKSRSKPVGSFWYLSDRFQEVDKHLRPVKNKKSIPPDERVRSIKQLLGTDRLILLDAGEEGQPTWSVDAVNAILQAGNFKKRPVVFLPPRIAECLRKSIRTEDRRGNRLTSLFLSLLDEAAVLLDQAESDLAECSQSTLWWSRVHLLRLRIYGMLDRLGGRARECAIFRGRSPDMGIFESFRQALQVSADDPIRRFRAVKYFLEAEHWYREYSGFQGAGSPLPNSRRNCEAAFEEICEQVDFAKWEDVDGEESSPRDYPLHHAIARLKSAWDFDTPRRDD